MKGIIISIINNKGGVGKSSVSATLGHALTRQNQRVLVVDNDPQGNASSLLLPRNSQLSNTLYEFLDLETNATIEKCIHATQYEGLFCIPNIPETGNLEPSLITSQTFDAFKNKLRPHAQQNFNFTIIDNPPNMGTFVITSLYGSDFVIVPTLANSTFSIDGLLQAIQLIDNIREAGNKNLNFLKLLINQVDKRKSISRYNIAQIKQHFPSDKIFNTMIPTNAPFETAESKGMTIFQEAPSSNGCKAYRQLAKELLNMFTVNKD
jgi:chromosome partitioning protein